VSVRMRVKSELELLFWAGRGSSEFIVYCPACASDHELSLEDSRNLLRTGCCLQTGQSLVIDEVGQTLERLVLEGPFEARAPGAHWPIR
jgi:hypothetical protein